MNRRACAAALMSALLVAGCATPPRTPAQASWAGRLALQVQDRPGQSFSAGFELRGSPQSGELSLLSPLGATLAVLNWRPGHATLTAQSRTSEYPSVDELVAQVAGAPIPITALFDWLRGIDTPVPGWQADLSRAGEGRIAARRVDPPPEADLRVVLER